MHVVGTTGWIAALTLSVELTAAAGQVVAGNGPLPRKSNEITSFGVPRLCPSLLKTWHTPATLGISPVFTMTSPHVATSANGDAVAVWLASAGGGIFEVKANRY